MTDNITLKFLLFFVAGFVFSNIFNFWIALAIVLAIATISGFEEGFRKRLRATKASYSPEFEQRLRKEYNALFPQQPINNSPIVIEEDR
jgi:hypothetical protein